MVPAPPNLRRDTAGDGVQATDARMEVEPVAFAAWLDGADDQRIHGEAWRFIGCLQSQTVFGLTNLTQRETETLQLMTEGLMNKEIATRMFVSTETVKNNLIMIFRKLKVDNRLLAVPEGVKRGLIRFP